jgi:hypothetical protein
VFRCSPQRDWQLVALAKENGGVKHLLAEADLEKGMPIEHA